MTERLSDRPWFEINKYEYKKKHAIIVGAGIAGVTTAWALAQRGWHIDLIEQQGTIAQEGSGNPLGILMPRISINESTEGLFYRRAYFKTIRELTKLKKEAPDFSWQQGGVLQLAVSRRILKQIDTFHFDSEFVQAVSPKEASVIAGVPINRKALYFPLAGWLNPGDLCERLIKASKGRIKLHFNTTVTRLYSQDGYWQLFDQENQVKLESEVVVLANAAQANQFQETNWLPLQPARGQISIRPATKKSRDIRCAICYEGYVLPEDAGTHVIGATFTRGDASTELRNVDDIENLRQLEQGLPGIFDDNPLEKDSLQGKERLVKGRAGVRAVTPDRMPMVGLVANVEYFKDCYYDLYKGKAASSYPKAQYLKGLYLNTGHGAKGLCSSFLSAELITSYVNNEVPLVSKTVQDALNPSRFLIRNFQKGIEKDGSPGN